MTFSSPIKKVLVVGGGPAGLMTAIMLAEKNINITLIEKKSWPIDKVCGEGIMPKGVEILREYQILSRVEENSLRKFDGISYFNGKDIAHGDFASGDGYVIRRTALSEALYEKACTYQNLKLLPNSEIKEINEFSDYIEAKFTSKPDSTELSINQFDLIVGCDGLKSKTRKLACMEAPPPSRKNRVGARVHYQIPPWSNKVEVRWLNGLESYVAATSNNSVEFIFGWNRDVIKFNNKEPVEEQLFNYFPELKKIIAGKKQVSNFQALGSLATGSQGPIKGRTVLIGDAATFLDPITGEGLSKAFEEAETLANLIGYLHTQAGQAALIKKISYNTKRYLLITKATLLLSKNPLLRKIVIKAFSYSPSLFQICLELNIGNLPFNKKSKLRTIRCGRLSKITNLFF